MQAEPKRVLEGVLQDLRAISAEAKKKHNHVKEAAESCVVKVRNISSASADGVLLQNLRAASSDVVHPLVVACATRNARLVQLALSAIQRLVQHRILEEKCASSVVSELWSLVEAECEELRVLQTLTPLVSTERIVAGHTLAKCIVMCFRLRFAKDPVVINAASAAVRQIVSCVFERVVQEDGLKSSTTFSVVESVQSSSDNSSLLSRAPPTTLRPCAADAYMLFKDLCLLVEGEPAVWLTGLQELSRTLGLELIESLLYGYPGVFFKHEEFTRLLREVVCPLIIRLFSPSIKHTQMSSLSSSALAQARAIASSSGMLFLKGSALGSPDRTNFPTAMRLVRLIVVLVNIYHQKLVTECEIFLSQLTRFLDADRPSWQRAIGLEALHRVVARPDVCLWLCANYDARGSNAILHKMLTGVLDYLRQAFDRMQQTAVSDDDSETGQSVGVPGFSVGGSWTPYIDDLTAKKGILMESLEKLEPPSTQEGYGVSRAFKTVVDATQALLVAYDDVTNRSNGGAAPMEVGGRRVEEALFLSMLPALLPALVILLEASTDETMAESILAAMATQTLVACRLGLAKPRHSLLFALASASLPACEGGYVRRCMGVAVPDELASAMENLPSTSSSSSDAYVYHQVVATGQPCPTANATATPPANAQLALTTKNVQAARVLLTCAEANVDAWRESWDFVVAACAHIAWLLAMRPSLPGRGCFVAARRKDGGEGDEGPSGSSNGGSSTSAAAASGLVTTAALSSDIPVVAEKLDRIIDRTTVLDEEGLHFVIGALCRLSHDAAVVSQSGREPSLFGVAKLLHTGSVNMGRFGVFWQPLTGHLVEISSHSFTPLREWANLSLTTLVKAAMKCTTTSMDEETRQHTALSSLAALSQIGMPDVRKRQIECLTFLLQSHGALLKPSQWTIVIDILSRMVDRDEGFSASIVSQAYTALRLIATDFIQALPLDCVSQLVEADALFGRQHADQNISLSALTQLWTISDFVFRRVPHMGPEAAEKIWLVLYTCLSDLCVDARPAVRKSACQTLLQTVAAHGQALRVATWKEMVWRIIMPMLDRVKTMTRNASKVREESELLVHHSRDTQAKQWTETAIQTLGGVVKIFNAQRGALLKLEDFPTEWSTLLEYLEWGAAEENAELSLASLKCLHELLLGRTGAQTLDINTTSKAVSRDDGASSFTPDPIPSLPPEMWLVSWSAWRRMGDQLVNERRGDEGAEKSSYLPGPSHLTTLLHVFPPLFERVKKSLPITEVEEQGVLGLLERIVCARSPSEQSPFVLPSSASALTPTQEAVLDCVRALHAEESRDSSPLHPALPPLIRLLLRLSELTVAPQRVRLATVAGKSFSDSARTSIIPFAESSLRLSIEFFSSSVAVPDVVRELVVVDVVRTLSLPMSLKYQCLSPSTWKLAATGFLNALKTGLPVARANVEHFAALWPLLAETIDKFLFTPNIKVRLSPDERRRDEFIDCQMVDLLRTEILPYSATLPPDFITSVISILNRGSISQVDSTDVLDTFSQRVELSRACFDALLSMTRETANGSRGLGSAAMRSLIDRCRGVMAAFMADARSIGDMRLPRTRVVETVAALKAVDALIDRLALRSDAAASELYSQLVLLHPVLVDMIPGCHSDSEVEASLVSTLKSYQTLLLLKSLPQNV